MTTKGIGDAHTFTNHNTVVHNQGCTFRDQHSHYFSGTSYAEKQASFFRWLSYFDAEDFEYGLKPAPGTCEWIRGCQQFLEWSEASSRHPPAVSRPLLYIFGKFGCGKTFVSRYLRKLLAKEETLVLYFSFDSKKEKSGKNTAFEFFRALLYQLLKHDQCLHESTETYAFRQAIALQQELGTKTCTSANVLQLRDLFARVLRIPLEIIIVIDGLDQCSPGPSNRGVVQDFIFACARKTIVTSRPEIEIKWAQEAQFSICRVIEVERRMTDADISLYIKHQVASYAVLKSLPDGVDDILKEQAQGVFLYVRLVVDEIREEARTMYDVQEALRRLPRGLEELYQNALEKLQNNGSERLDVKMCLSIFEWLLTAERPLTVAGLHMALRAGPLKGQRYPGVDHQLGAELLEPAARIASCCFPLIEVLPDDTARLVHFSAAEFFKTQVHRIASLEAFHFDPAAANGNIALTCIEYLSTGRGAVGEIPLASMSEDSEEYEFLSYAVARWPSHLSKSKEKEFDRLREALVRFCQPDNPGFSSWVRDRASLDGVFKITFRIEDMSTQLPHPLHVAAYCGLEQLAEELIRGDQGAICSRDATGATPLHVAAQHSGTLVKLLLQHDAEHDAIDESEQTPLHRAAAQGYLYAVEELLNNGAARDPLDSYHRTPLFLASLKGNHKIAQKLLERGAHASLQLKSLAGETPFTVAIVNGHIGVVKILLSASGSDHHLSGEVVFTCARKGYSSLLEYFLQKRMIDVKEADPATKQTALHAAAMSGQEKVVELFLRFKAEVDAREKSERTPLYFAAEKGHLGVVKRLLSKEAGADVNALDRLNQTVLFKPAGKGHVEVVRYLLESGIDPRATDSCGRTALHFAACSAQPETTKLLLEYKCLVDAKESEGRTALHWISMSGRDNIVPILLENKASTEIKDKYGNAPIHLAASHKQFDTFKLLLSRSKRDAQNEKGQTPLHLATAEGYSPIVARLLEVGTSASLKDIAGRTPLHYAALQGDDALVELLLASEGELHASALDTDHRTPLHLAALNGHEEVAIRLININKAILMAEDKAWKKPADLADASGFVQLATRIKAEEEFLVEEHLAAQSKRHKAARRGEVITTKKSLFPLLCFASGIQSHFHRRSRSHAVDYWGRSPLHWYAIKGHDKVIYKLTSKSTIDWDKADKSRKTPLHYAIENRHETSAKHLIDAEVACDAPDIVGRRPLYYASEFGLWSVVMELISSGEVDINARDKWGRTALHQASLHGHTALVKLLFEHGADVDVKDNQSRTPLYLASKKGHGMVVQLLIHGSANVMSVDSKLQRTALHRAAEKGLDKVVSLLVENLADVDAKDTNGQLALHLAACFEHDMVLAKLLRVPVSQADVCDNDGNLALHCAVVNGNEHAALILIKAGSDVARENGLQQNVLHIAGRHGHESLMKTLASQYGTRIPLNTSDQWGMFPLGYAAEKGYTEVAELLIEAGSDITARSDDQLTFLHIAAKNWNEEVVELLISKGALPDIATYRTGQTALHIATDAEEEHTGIVRRILGVGSNANALDSEGDTPIHLAVRRRHRLVVEQLLAAGADPKIQNFKRQSPQKTAKENGWEAEFSLLLSQSRQDAP